MSISITITAFILQCGVLVYDIFMILYLTKASKCDQYLDKRDSQFRQAALILTYISAVIAGLSLLGTLTIQK
jgi:hypothetical protein